MKNSSDYSRKIHEPGEPGETRKAVDTRDIVLGRKVARIDKFEQGCQVYNLITTIYSTRDYSNYKINVNDDKMKESRENHNVVVMDRNFFSL